LRRRSFEEFQHLTLEMWIPVQPFGLLLGWKEAQGMAPPIGAPKALWIHEEF
jgi:hypothetical protein